MARIENAPEKIQRLILQIICLFLSASAARSSFWLPLVSPKIVSPQRILEQIRPILWRAPGSKSLDFTMVMMAGDEASATPWTALRPHS